MSHIFSCKGISSSIILGALLLFSKSSSAQDTYHFDKGLVIGNVYHYGREAIYQDDLAWNLYNGTLKKPVAGESLGTTVTEKKQVWKTFTANTQKRFGDRSIMNGYLYLTYESPVAQSAVLNIRGNSALYFNGVLHAGDPYRLDWMYIPVKLKKGVNELYIRGQNVSASLSFPSIPIAFNKADLTLPDVVLDKNNAALSGAIVVINTSEKELRGLTIKSMVMGKVVSTPLPAILPLATRKVIFKMDASALKEIGEHQVELSLIQSGKVIDTSLIKIAAVNVPSSYKNTFVSEIDGSLQYYAVTPNLNTSRPGEALFFSVHGAGVEAIGQAKAYKPKDWGTVVTPTNRRPRGFNWEDWGRLDALEVLGQATTLYRPDPQQIYLTGHSMGGHGTWFLGATYPDKWAGIAPCSGYPTLKEYGSADGLIPEAGKTAMESMLLRASNQSDVIKLAKNYQKLGVYILHGDSDKVVSVKYARQMKNVLADFHTDYSYYEYPGGEHWFGDQSVDWKPIFDFFKWHKRQADSSSNQINFTTANPGISARYYWTSVLQQQNALEYSNIQLQRNIEEGKISGKTTNVKLLKLNLTGFNAKSSLQIDIDDTSLQYTVKGNSDSIFLRKEDHKWTLGKAPLATDKNPLRNGTFKDGFRNRMLFVYGTTGNESENAWNLNKARYDAETWYYRGNGAVDIIADRDYKPSTYKGRNIVIYGNATTNGAWKTLLSDCPIQVFRNLIKAGKKTLNGDDLAANFVWPLKGTNENSVSVIAGTGTKGQHTASANQYLAGGSGFPDIFIYRMSMLKNGTDGIELAGFFNNHWKLAVTSQVEK